MPVRAPRLPLSMRSGSGSLSPNLKPRSWKQQPQRLFRRRCSCRNPTIIDFAVEIVGPGGPTWVHVLWAVRNRTCLAP